MGYNCTVFAYGQTGTGKTFTMEGGEKRSSSVSWDQDPTSGIIPRALANILDKLKEQSDQLEYSVKISFLELYNEEIFDLLSSVDDTSKLRLYEDAQKRGSVIIQVPSGIKRKLLFFIIPVVFPGFGGGAGAHKVPSLQHP